MSEMLFLIGVVLTIVSIIGAIAAGIILTAYRKKLQETLEKEYGKKRTALR